MSQSLSDQWAAEVSQNKTTALAALQAGGDESRPRGSPLKPDPRKLHALTTILADRYLGCVYEVEQAEKQLSSAHKSLSELRRQLEEAEEDKRETLEKVLGAAKAERATLVAAALGSLQQLRAHLTVALTNQPVKKPDHPERFEYSKLQKRWAVFSGGSYDQVVVKLDPNDGPALAAPPRTPHPWPFA